MMTIPEMDIYLSRQLRMWREKLASGKIAEHSHLGERYFSSCLVITVECMLCAEIEEFIVESPGVIDLRRSPGEFAEQLDTKGWRADVLGHGAVCSACVRKK